MFPQKRAIVKLARPPPPPAKEFTGFFDFPPNPPKHGVVKEPLSLTHTTITCFVLQHRVKTARLEKALALPSICRLHRAMHQPNLTQRVVARDMEEPRNALSNVSALAARRRFFLGYKGGSTGVLCSEVGEHDKNIRHSLTSSHRTPIQEHLLGGEAPD